MADVENAAEPPKRGCGRPKKGEVKVKKDKKADVEQCDDVDQEDSDQPKRKRGRPEGSTKRARRSSPKKGPTEKGRGIPRKSEDSDQPKRKRGRPEGSTKRARKSSPKKAPTGKGRGIPRKSMVFNPEWNKKWKKYQRDFDKNYTEDEKDMRRLIWEQCIVFVEQHNLEYEQGKHTFTVGINQFSDMTKEEKSAYRNPKIVNCEISNP